MLKKKLTSCVLVLSILSSVVTPAFAGDGTDLSATALMVSEEYAAAYPNGVFEFATVEFETREGAADFDVIVVRRGGTAGRAEVDFKVIEITAKYGADFTVLMPKWYRDEELAKEKDSPTLLEASLEENKEGLITSPKYFAENLGEEPAVEEPTVKEAVYEGPVVEELTFEEPAMEEAMDERPTVEEAVYEELTVEEAVYEEHVYKSSLHQMRDAAVGEVSVAPETVKTQTNIFDIEDPEQIKVGDALNTLLRVGRKKGSADGRHRRRHEPALRAGKQLVGRQFLFKLQEQDRPHAE